LCGFTDGEHVRQLGVICAFRLVDSGFCQLEEEHLNDAVFQRTTRSLTATERSCILHRRGVGAGSRLPKDRSLASPIAKGSLYVALFCWGRSGVDRAGTNLCGTIQLIDIRLRLWIERLIWRREGLDISFFLGEPADSNLRIKPIADCDRVPCGHLQNTLPNVAIRWTARRW
jgi:hypothetical protein